ncbi:MAG: excinuclease ABC subunit C, partial [Lachnospiraceae bacterium]|nr:excinuclease ABC subunit C [Lachnospiraceae bacterium]
GMVKDDHHRTRGLYFRNVEIPIDTHSEGFRLITRIQDEAHRFAIEYHRSIRGKTQLHSVLDDIPGIGLARRKALMRAFGDIEKIRAAGRDELAAVDGVTEAVAENIYRYFHADRPERAEETADAAAPAPERQPEED